MPSQDSSLLPPESQPPVAASSADAARAAQGQDGSEYQVVARRYRPQTFDELVGQEHVARALTNAITTGRVGHAYLFTGARGVGKTSAARILAKALDCVHGPTPTPCNRCDICESIASGNDVDVLEIDGASNRGIDEIRQLRQNVGIRPSRAHFKIYIIDEVHMLTREAFNALLKTLEEPPEHVKFIFCTTEANKIPITILSRCQRFDFAGIRAPSIRERLRQIAEAEGVEAEPAALDLLARRANGSMRDSQSLLEQLLSFGGRTILAADVHALLGTAGDARLVQLLTHLVDRDAAAALTDLDAALIEGVDVGQLLEQLLSVCRDAMAAAVGCPAESFLYTSPEQQTSVAAAGRTLGLETILAILQIIDQALARMRYSTQGRTLAETALVRICYLENLDALSSLLSQLQDGSEPASSGNAGPGNARPAPATNRPQAAQPPARPESVPAARRSDSDGSKKKADLNVAEATIPATDSTIPATTIPAASAIAPRVASEYAEYAAGEVVSGKPQPAAPDHADGPSTASGPPANGVSAAASSTHSPPPRHMPAAPPERLESRPATEEAGQTSASATDSASGICAESRLTAANANDVWQTALATLTGTLLADYAASAQRIASSAPNRLAVGFPERYNFHKSFCERPDQLTLLQRAVSEAAGGNVQIEFGSFASDNKNDGGSSHTSSNNNNNKGPVVQQPVKTVASSRQWLAEKSNDPFVKQVAEIFGATPFRADPPAEQ